MKKKNIYAVLSAMIALAVIMTSLAAPSFARRKLGDVDGDGRITSTDARLALRASVRLENLTEEQALAADVDGNTFITSSDARTILRASVRLETLPDVYVGGDTEESTTEPEQPSEPEATPTDPEPTTGPEQPSEPEATPTDPEPTTGPEQPSDETTTEPEQPSGIIPPAENNEYEILRSGTYYMKGCTVDSSGKSGLEIAKTPNSLYLGSKFDNVKIAVLTIDGKVYLVNPEKKYYLDLNTGLMKAEMKALGVDVNDFANSSSFDFSYFPPLEKATKSEEIPGGYVRYVFEAANGSINVTMDGKTLISLENARDGSVYRIDFTSVSSQVPSEMRELKNLKARTQTLFVASLISTGN